MRVLFVCLGNICRSPSAEGVFRHLVHEAGLAAQLQTDSAGTIGNHIGSPPDPRSCATALARGIDIADLRGRQIDRGDFEAFDYVVALDEQNLSDLAALCPPAYQGRLSLLLDHTEHQHRAVPDPYLGGQADFESALDLIESGCAGLLSKLRAEHEL